MEFVEQDEEIEMQVPQSNNYVTVAAEAARRGGGYKYKECLKNHAVAIGGNAVDGCREFMAAGEEGTLEALRCAACNCHRNFHRKQIEGETMLALQQQQYYHRPSGYLVTPMSQYPSSSGGGSSKKRFRTKFTWDQKEKMTELAERLGWCIQQQDEAMVQKFCAETGIQRQVFKVWMHNNKYTLGKQLR
ncbi:Zinc-finger homeodomain protein 2 [Heracleum sosnowskyi]|uniref:Zinc-finger homeodomain protein 2 n=1 Tax=Heracleum sosnowskyi TaxID=360622 RepID=A0AAD8MZJ3_9APIA|nr:Zinc-finger homeodomain protein 2 [Heracleum sosnowskyi]